MLSIYPEKRSHNVVYSINIRKRVITLSIKSNKGKSENIMKDLVEVQSKSLIGS